MNISLGMDSSKISDNNTLSQAGNNIVNTHIRIIKASNLHQDILAVDLDIIGGHLLR